MKAELDIWVCPRCGTVNLPLMKNCRVCGARRGE